MEPDGARVRCEEECRRTLRAWQGATLIAIERPDADVRCSVSVAGKEGQCLPIRRNDDTGDSLEVRVRIPNQNRRAPRGRGGRRCRLVPPIEDREKQQRHCNGGGGGSEERNAPVMSHG